MKPAAINAVAAICNLGGNWNEIWRNLLLGRRLVHPYFELDQRFPDLKIMAACVSGLDRSICDEPAGAGACCRMLEPIVRQLSAANSGKVMVFGATNHGESDALVDLVIQATADPESSKAQTLFSAMRSDITHRQAALSFRQRESSGWVYSACSSSLHSLSLALASLSASHADCCAVMGADALSPIGVAGFYRAGALGRQGHCAPFDPRSEALLIGEGAAGILLSRSASQETILVTGIGMSCDAGHPTHPDPSGMYMQRAILSALGQAEACPADIGLVVAHGTGTPANDRVEAAVLARVFGAGTVPVTSVKGMIGHCMGAAGIFNLLVGERALREGAAPAAIPAATSIEGVDLILGGPRPIDRNKAVLVLNAGFGGNNVAVVLRGLQ